MKTEKKFKFGIILLLIIILLIINTTIVLAGTTTVSGNLKYNNSIPIKYSETWLNGLPYVVLTNYFTDSSGDYSFNPIDNQGNSLDVTTFGDVL